MSLHWLAQIGANPGGVALFYAICLLGPLVLLLLVLCIYLLLIITGIISGTVPKWIQNRSSRFRRRAVLDDVFIVAYDKLTQEQHDAIFALRHNVFVAEQEIWSEPDRDGKDPDCLHVLAILKGRVVGTCRLMSTELDGARCIKLGRLAVSRKQRRRGIGAAIVTRVNRHLAEEAAPGLMHAQAHLEDWYAGLGWHREGEPFMEAGIRHVQMRFTPGNAA